MDKRKLSILIVADDLSNSREFSKIIDSALPGTEVFIALDKSKALKLAKEYEPDVILIDVSINKADSLEISQIFKEEKALQLIPMLFITDLENDRDFRKEALKVGADAFLIKPLEDTILITQLKSMAKIKERNILISEVKEKLEILVELQTKNLRKEIDKREKIESELRKSENLLSKKNKELSLRLEQTIDTISKIGEIKDVYTAGHQKNVRLLACAIAREMKLSDNIIYNISIGALIHDIGKINIPSDILNKTGKISSLEYQILQSHVEYSYEIVKEIDFPKQVIDMIYQHHERQDGSGYPQKLAGEEIILESRILAVADVVEAMTSHRPYRPALGIYAAIDEISRNRGIKYDSKVVDTCIKLFKEMGFTFSD